MLKITFLKFYYFAIAFVLWSSQNIYSIESDKIIIDFYPRPPFYMKENGVNYPNDGIIYHLAVKILAAANIPYEFNLIPFIRATMEIKENKTRICAPSAYKTKEREEFSYFSKPIFQDKKTVLIIRKNDERFKKYNTFDNVLKDSNLKILLKIGISYGGYTDEKILQYKNIVLSKLHQDKHSGVEFTSDDNSSMLNDIAYKKADYTFITGNEAEYLFKRKNTFKSLLTILPLKDQPEGEKRYFMCSKIVGVDTMNKIDKAISKIVR
jgi:polar amino acid transport system substrate-binding protein